MPPLSMFIPLSKVDVEKRLVYGIATAEQPDRSGETCDYATSKPHFEKWSADVHAASGGLSKGNVRVMHGNVAAGKLTDLVLNDASKQVEVCAEIVDDNEWNKVLKGVYTGFSQGGKYVKRWTDEQGVKRYTAQPSEISLVDLPCLASATFEMVKGEGLAPERHHFAPEVQVQPPTNEAVMARADALAKAAGVADFAPFLDAARDELTKAALPAPEPVATPSPADLAANAPKHDGHQEPPAPLPAPDAEDKQVWQSGRDKSVHATKADMRRHHAMLDAQKDAAPALDAVRGMGKAAAGPRPKLGRETGPDALAKDLAAASRLADLVQSLAWLQTRVQAETVREGDGSTMASRLKDAITTLGELLPEMVTEEVAELFNPASTGGMPTPDYYYNAAGMLPPGHLDALVKVCSAAPALAGSPTLAKVGARHSAKDMGKIQAMHDHACDLGAACKPVEKATGAEDLAKAAGDLAKVTGERDEALGKIAAAETARDAALEKLDQAKLQYDALKEITAKIPNEIAAMRKAFEAQPVPAHLVGRAVPKVEDGGGRDPGDKPTPAQIADMMKDLSQEDRALVMLKAAQGHQMRVG